MHLSQFKPARVNANRHTARGIGALEKSIQSDGWIGAMTTAADGEMIAGSARIETAAGIFGVEAEPVVIHSDGKRPIVVIRDDIPNAQTKAAQRLALADNQIHALDYSIDVDVLLGFDADVLGDLWDASELSALGDAWAQQHEQPADDPGAQIDKANALAQEYGTALGQVWRLGKHRLAVGDCTDAVIVAKVMDGAKAALVVTDPPYGAEYDGNNRPSNNRKQYGLLENDESDPSKLTAFATDTMDTLDAVLRAGGVVYLCAMMASYCIWRAALERRFKMRAIPIWVKDNPAAGRSDFFWGYEVLFYGTKEGEKHTWNGGRGQSDVWQFRSVNSFGYVKDDGTRNANNDTQVHPTQKPVDLVEHALKLSSNATDLVFDGFLGSGTTLIACERLGRQCRAVEIDPGYAAVAISRWEKLTGEKATLLDSVQT